MTAKRVSLVVAIVLTFAAPGPAVAGPGAESPEYLAHTLGEEGLRLFQAAKWKEAYEVFRSAAAAVRAPTLVLYMGHCQARMGNLLEARRLYQEVVQAPVADDAPLQFRTAKRVAREELRWVDQQLALVSIAIPGAPEARVRVLVDGVPMSAAELDDIALKPGTHVVQVTVQNATPVTRTISAEAGRKIPVVVPFPWPSNEGGPQAAGAPAPPTAGGPSETPLPDAPRAGPNLTVPAAVAFAAGGAALVAGAVTGVMALRSAADVKSRCDALGHCLPSDQANGASAGRLGDASTGAFVAGGVAVATGIVLVVLNRRSKSTPPALGAVEVQIGLGYGAVGGGF